MSKLSSNIAVGAFLIATAFANSTPALATAASGVDTNQTILPFSIQGTQVMAMDANGLNVGGNVTVSGNGLNNSAGYQIVEGNKTDWLRINQNNSFKYGTAAYGAWSFGSGGVTIGAWNTSPPATGSLYVSNNVAIGAMDGQLGAGQLYVATSIGVGVAKPGYSVDASGGSMAAAAYYHTSDVHLKTDIHPISHALDKLLAIKGVQFNWKQDGRADMGVVAQNVAEVFPDIVSKNKDGMMSVEYDSLVGPMIESIRELKEQNDELRDQIASMNEMKAQLDEVRSTLKDLKTENQQLQSIRAEKSLGTSPSVSIDH